MSRKFAVPLEKGVLCTHFGHCEEFAIVTIDGNRVSEVERLTPPEHVPGLYPRWVASHGVTDVIAGGMGQKAIHLFNENCINTFVGAPIKDAETLVNDFLEDKLELTANYCNHDENHKHNCGH